MLDVLVDVAFGAALSEVKGDISGQGDGGALDRVLLRDCHGAAAHARLVLNGLQQYSAVSAWAW